MPDITLGCAKICSHNSMIWLLGISRSHDCFRPICGLPPLTNTLKWTDQHSINHFIYPIWSFQSDTPILYFRPSLSNQKSVAKSSSACIVSFRKPPRNKSHAQAKPTEACSIHKPNKVPRLIMGIPNKNRHPCTCDVSQCVCCDNDKVAFHIIVIK